MTHNEARQLHKPQNFINPAFCPEKQTKNPYRAGLSRNVLYSWKQHMHCTHGATNMVINSQALSRAGGIKTVCHPDKAGLQNILDADENNNPSQKNIAQTSYW